MSFSRLAAAVVTDTIAICIYEAVVHAVAVRVHKAPRISGSTAR